MKTFLDKYGWYILLILVAYFPLFGHLEALPIRIWDEGRNAMNAYEMYKSGDYLVTMYNGLPDMWNTKPPLLAWMQVFFMKTIGVNELAIRLPSALAALGTCLVLFRFISRYLQKKWLGFIVVCVLLTSLGYVHDHVARTGDYDALLVFFTTTSALVFFTYVEKKEVKYLYWFYVLIALGVLTKSIAALLFFPAFFIYALLQKEILLLLKNKHFYIGLVGFLFVIFGFYLWRDARNPGYISAVFENELGGRYLDAKEKNESTFLYYFNNMKLYLYAYWLYLVPLGFMAGIVSKEARQTRLAVFVGLCVGVFFLVISFGKTKLQWYDAPLYPFMAILVALFLGRIVDFIQSYEKRFTFLKNGYVSAGLMVLVFIQPIQPIIYKTYKPVELYWDIEFYALSSFLRDGIRGKHDISGKKIVYDGYKAHIQFYERNLQDVGQYVQFVELKDIKKGDEIIVSQDNMKSELEKKYIFETVFQQKNIEIVRIHARKNDTQN